MFVLKEIEDFPDYYEIPSYSNYGIRRDGVVINRRTGNTLTGSINPDGYCNFRITDDSGTTLTWGRHRLLAYVFKNPGCDIADLVVNHKNGIKGDDYLDNLEWVTYQGNAEHAGANGLTEKCKPLSVRDVDTGKVLTFPSIVECARAFSMTKDAVVHRLKFGEKRVFPERKQYRYGHEDLPWHVPGDDELENIQYGRERKVLVRYLLSDTVVTYDKATDAAKAINVAISTLSVWLNDNANIPIRSGFVQVKWCHDVTPWRVPLKPYTEYRERTGKRIVGVKNVGTKVVTIFKSAAECCDALNIKPTALNYRLKSNGQTVFSDGNTYSYLDTYESGPTSQ